uniref:Secreted protein n=1 Tax=Achlya hypogyna TaxID=1202772 RepID=A0A0A7CN74_ACHHY|nr:secreted protein [Achlya hypogyna]
MLLKQWALLLGATAAIPIFHLDEREMSALVHLYTACTVPAQATQIVHTWCTGAAVPRGICAANEATHPCTGRVLELDSPNASIVAVRHKAPWFGITCDWTTDPVAITAVTLPYQGLRCTTLDLNFSSFPSLRVLDFEGNALTGSVPSWVATLPQLQVLNFNLNNLTGGLPASITDAPQLTELSLHGNFLDGPLPDGMDIPPFELLDLGSNFFTGSIPGALLRSTRLQYLDLSVNAFQGRINADAQLPAIRHFDVAYNDLRGPLPVSLSSWGSAHTGAASTLAYLDVSNNALESTLPASLATLDALKHLSVANNTRLFGRVPVLPPALYPTFDPNNFVSAGQFSCPLPTIPQRQWGNVSCACGQGSALLADGSCTLCDPGMFSNDTVGQVCTLCSPGTFSLQGAAECSPCLAGFFANASGVATCVPCAATFPPTGPLVAPLAQRGPRPTSTATPALNALPELFLHKAGRANPAAPALLLQWHHQVLTVSLDDICTYWGVFYPMDSGTSSACPALPLDLVGSPTHRVSSRSFNNGSFAACQRCPPGSAIAFPGASNCVVCAIGSFAGNQGSTHCTPSPPGTSVRVLGATMAHPCLPGTFAAAAGSSSCSICPTNMTSTVIGATACSEPPPGFVVAAVSWPQLLLTVPVDVPFVQSHATTLQDLIQRAWLYFDLSITATVLQIFPNADTVNTQYAGNTSSSVRIALAPANATPWDVIDKIAYPIATTQAQIVLELLWQRAGWPIVTLTIDLLSLFETRQPVPCPSGSFFEASACHSCPPGTVASAPSSLACTPCPVDTFASASGASKCTRCPIDTHAPIAGSATCAPCPLMALTTNPQCRTSLDALIFYPTVALGLCWAMYATCRRSLHGLNAQPEELLEAFRTRDQQTVNTILRPLPKVISAPTLTTDASTF